MKRALGIIITLLLACGDASALPLRGGGSSCPSPTVDGSLVTAPSNCTITAEGFTWSFGAITGDGINYTILVNGAPRNIPGTKIGRNNGGNFWWATSYPTCGLVWRMVEPVFGYSEFGTAFGVLTTPAFANTTQGAAWRSFAELVTNDHGLRRVNDGDTLTIGASSAQGIPCWPDNVYLDHSDDSSSIPFNNLTLNFATGTKFADSQTAKGIFVIRGTGTSLNGNSSANRVDIQGAVRMDDGASGATIQDATIHTDCEKIGTSCILGGAIAGTTILTNVLVYGGGGGGGQDHQVYLSIGGGTADTGCYSVNNLVSLNGVGVGWLWKDRRCMGAATRGVITNSTFGCTTNDPTRCAPHAIMNPTCGGNHLYSHDVIEMPPTSQDTWHIILYGDDLVNVGTSVCSTVTPNHVLSLDQDIIINDGIPNSGPNIGIVDNRLANAACTITNSAIVNNPSSANMTAGVSGVAGTCSFGSGNRFYASRSAAATGEGWSGDYTDPTTGTVYSCCAFPWLPRPL